MHREEALAEIGGALKVREDMGKEMIGVCEAGILVVIDIAILCVGRVRRWCEIAVVEDDDFVDREDCRCSGYLTGEKSLKLSRLCADTALVASVRAALRERAYFARMLPGNAMLSVHFLPPCGLNSAVGFDVSFISAALEAASCFL